MLYNMFFYINLVPLQHFLVIACSYRARCVENYKFLVYERKPNTNKYCNVCCAMREHSFWCWYV